MICYNFAVRERRESLSFVPLRIGFLASHNGTDMQEIVHALSDGRIRGQANVIISNNGNSSALEFARKNNIPALYISSTNSDNPDRTITNALITNRVNLVVLSGWMKEIGGDMLKAFPGKIINVHPADTQKYGGKGMYGDHVHQAVIDAAEEFTYPTIHIVDSGIDTGRVLSQGKVKVEKDDSVLSLRQKVQEEEKRLYIQTLQDIYKGKIKL